MFGDGHHVYVLGTLSRAIAGRFSRDKHMAVLYGERNTGKGGFLDFLTASFQDYVGNFEGEILTQSLITSSSTWLLFGITCSSTY
eukprot:2803355-Rhodomonas_salina.1